MAGRKPSEAVTNFLDPLQLAASCVTDSIFRPSADGYKAGEGHALLLNKGEPVPLTIKPEPGHENAPERLLLSAQLEYDVIKLDEAEAQPGGPWKVRTRAYRYHLMTEDYCEVLLWHWHPGGQSHYGDPHLHIGGTQLQTNAVISKARHNPTGRIAFEQVLLQLLGEFEVVHRREDWHTQLNATLERFATWRTWT